jgi:thioredoxin 1
MTRRLLLLVLMAAWTITYAPGCGGGQKPAAPAKADTTATTGAVCDTTLVPDSATSAAAADTAAKPKVEKPKPKPAPEPEKVAAKPKELPKMWDFGSENCIPCKEMLRILTPMMADYKDKVDIRIINVYEDKARTQQFRIVTIPTQVFIDAQGKELFRHIGVYPRDSIEARFKQYGFIN